MRLPRTSHPQAEPLAELVLGRGDYTAGGARTVPFLDLDGARRRRPLIFGEVSDRPEDYPELLREMFSGRQSDPEEWAVMWKEIGADGIWLDLHDGDSGLVGRISSRTRLPMAVTASSDILSEIGSMDDTVMILMDRDGFYEGPAGCHAVAVGGRTPDELAENCLRAEADGIAKIVIDLGCSPLKGDLGSSISFAEAVRERALSGEASLRHPTIADVTCCWNEGFSDAREASMWEGEAALATMLAGADMIIVRGPGAADMARVYGEELADL